MRKKENRFHESQLYIKEKFEIQKLLDEAVQTEQFLNHFLSLEIILLNRSFV